MIRNARELNALLSLTLLAAGALAGPAANDGPADHTDKAPRQADVFPTGLFPDDVVNVQAALDSFEDGVDGVVVLKARTAAGVSMSFNFGADPDPGLRGQVSPDPIRNGSIELRGERLGNDQTVVVGGNVPIVIDRPDDVVIRDILFARPYLYAMWIRTAKRVRIESNTILSTEGVREFGTGDISRAIRVSPGQTGDDTITGPVTIHDNTIIGSTAFYTDGMTLNSIGGTLQVTQNSIAGVQVGIRVAATRGTTSVVGNEIQVEPTETPGFFATGIQILGTSTRTGRTIVRQNSITASNPGSTSFMTGISLNSFDDDFIRQTRNVVVVLNDLLLEDTQIGIDLYAESDAAAASASDNSIVANTLSGTTGLAISLDGVSQGAANVFRNRINANRHKGLVSSSADLFLSAATGGNSAVVRADAVVVDQGTDNEVVVVPFPSPDRPSRKPAEHR